MSLTPSWLRRKPVAAPAAPAAPPSLPPRSLGVLRELTLEDRFGEVEVRPGDPGMEIAEDVCFVPDTGEGGWGVFGPDDQPLPASLDFNLPSNSPMWPRSVSRAPWAQVTKTLPDADYLYFGFVHLHFGHFLVDTLSRSWPLLDGGLNGRKLLYHGWGSPDVWWAEHPWAVELLSALGVRKSDFVQLTEPVRVKRLQLPGRSFQGQTYAYEAHGRLCRMIGAALLDEAALGEGPVYLSKTRLDGGVRRVVNEHKLEAFLRPRGVEILHPETLTVREQVSLFAAGRTVSGTLTSAFHSSLFAPPAGRIVAIDAGDRVNSNYFMIDRLNGNTATYQQALGSRPVQPVSPGWMVEDSFRDPVAIGRELLHLL